MDDQVVTTLHKVVLVKFDAFCENNVEHLTVQQYERGELLDALSNDKPFTWCQQCGEYRKVTAVEKQLLHSKPHDTDDG